MKNKFEKDSPKESKKILIIGLGQIGYSNAEYMTKLGLHVEGFDIIKIPNVIPVATNVSEIHIPEWIKNNAGWWADNLLSDEEFTKSIQYLITQRIIKI